MRLPCCLGQVLGLALFFALVHPLDAQLSESFVIQTGMETAWKSQVQMPFTGDGVVGTHLWVDPSSAQEYAVVQLSDRTIRIPASLPSRDGSPIGIEEAKKRAKAYAARLLGDAKSVEVSVVSVPDIRLIITTSDGLVQSIDAETGELVWSSACGPVHSPAFASALSPEGIVVVHGQKLFLLDYKTGKHRFQQELKYGATSGLVVCGDLAFVVDITGRVRAYGLSKLVGTPYTYIVTGTAVGEPVSLADSPFGALATDRGYLYVFTGGKEPSEWIRYESNSAITGSLTSANGAFYVANARGTLSKITLDERMGHIQWEYRTGDVTTSPALIAGRQVYVASEAGGLSSVDDNSGLAKWTSETVRVDQPVAVAGSNVFCTTASGALVSLDRETGSVVALSRRIVFAKPIPNQLNDRVYIVTAGGQIQCLRPIGAKLPTMMKPVPLLLPEGEATGDVAASDAGAGTETNTFDGGMEGDPFGEGAVDPFGEAAGGEDPFGGDAGGMEDPFGGSGSDEDPFGSSGF
ncbi:MAG: PQQ-binding-like beta-propeller repeat protein [Aureliella sp.]